MPTTARNLELRLTTLRLTPCDLTTRCNGRKLPSLLRKARARLQAADGSNGSVVVTSVDLNGVTESNENGHCKILTTKALREVRLQP